jgi:hypothetical protein
MNAQLSNDRISPNWRLVCGLVLVVAVVKEVASGVAHSPLRLTSNRPSLAGTLVISAMVRDAVKSLGAAV